MRSVLVVCALSVGAGACLGTPPALDVDAADAPIDADVDAEVDAAMCRDADGDGWTVDCGGAKYFDCNDDDAAVHPGAVERVGTTDHDCIGGGLAASEAFPDLTVSPFAGTGQVMVTRFGRYVLLPTAGHQLGSISVQRQAGGLTEELIYGGPTLREMFSGVHVWDDFLAVDPDASTLGSLDPDHRGPVVYQAIVAYWAGGTDQDRSLDGSSTYTFTIDGRIIRTDQLVLAEQPVHEDTNDYPGITSHLSLAARGPSSGATNLDTLVVRDSVAGVLDTPLLTNPGSYGSLGNPASWLWSCARGPEVEVGFVPSIPLFGGQPRRQPRATTNVGGAPAPYRQIALQYDWQVGVMQNPPNPPALLTLGAQRGHFMFVPRGRSGDDCEVVDQQAMAYLNPPPLAFGDPATGEIETTDAADDNTDGYAEGGGYWNVRAFAPTGLRISLVSLGGTTVPPHPLFRIRDLPPAVDPIVIMNGQRLTQGRHYRLQADRDVGVWLSMMAGMPLGHEVELVYPEPCSAACTP